MMTFFPRDNVLVLGKQEVDVRTGLRGDGARRPLPFQDSAGLAGGDDGQDQQDDVVDQNQADREQEGPEHRLPVVEAFLLVQSRQPAAARDGDQR